MAASSTCKANPEAPPPRRAARSDFYSITCGSIPFYPPVALGWSDGAHYIPKQYLEAATALQSRNTHAVRAWLAATYAQTGKFDQA